MTDMKGSRLRMCEWVNEHPEQFESHFAEWPSLQAFRSGEPLRWLVPQRPLCREVRDGLWKLAKLPGDSPQAAGWWPPRGPVWDGVALVPGSRGVLLVEAKSHLSELKSSGTTAQGDRLELIETSLRTLKRRLGVPLDTPWTKRYYQLANRLAYLWFMRERGIDAWMLSVYFTGDHFEPAGNRVFPKDAAGWKSAINDAYAALSLPSSHPLSEYTFTAFVPANP